MNTAVNIPWDAVVQGGPASADKRLPLVVSEHCRLSDRTGHYLARREHTPGNHGKPTPNTLGVPASVPGGRASVRAAVPEGNAHPQPDTIIALVGRLEEALRTPARTMISRSPFSSL